MAVPESVAKLLDRAPGPPGVPIPGGVSEEDLLAFEARNDLKIPEELADWLRFTSGPLVGPGGLFGIRPDSEVVNIETYFDLYPIWKSKKWIPIAGDGCGNYYLMATTNEYGRGHPIFFIDTHEDPDTPTYVVASDIWHFIRFLLEKEIVDSGWPFDKDAVLRADPAIENYRGLPFPW